MSDLCDISKQTVWTVAILLLGRIKKIKFDFEIQEFYFVPIIASRNFGKPPTENVNWISPCWKYDQKNLSWWSLLGPLKYLWLNSNIGKPYKVLKQPYFYGGPFRPPIPKHWSDSPYLKGLNKFFDSIILSMRTSKIQNGRQGAPKWPTGSGKGSTPKFLGAPVNFC